MIIAGMLAWWYKEGWRQQVAGLSQRLSGLLDYFSFDLLFRTLFAPFRQISAGPVSGPLGVKIHAFFDRLISQLIGAMVRLFMIIFGSVAIALYGLAGGLVVVAWALVPLLPFIGLTLALAGWLPWSA